MTAYESFEKEYLRLFGGPVPPAFRQLETLYTDWNSKINVISRKDIDNLYTHHVLHSLCIAAHILESGISLDGASILDLGCGGGFPGIPLAIMFPQAQFTLCDSVGKKTIVASAVAESLGLANVKVVNARAEALPDNYDYIVSRAVTDLDSFLGWVRNKYNKGILYLKGGDVAAEIAQCSRKYKLSQSNFHVSLIRRWLPDEYFDGKVLLCLNK